MRSAHVAARFLLLKEFMTAVRASDITIAVTVYNRAEHVQQAVASALAQTVPSGHVMVVEDCSPADTIREPVLAAFGDRIVYHRNSRTRGLFDNWNACIELCRTRWLCILHDDDFLEPTFVEAMVELAAAAPGRGLYYGACRTVDSAGRVLIEPPPAAAFEWSELDIAAWARYDPLCFPGQLFDVALARELGGFRAASRYAGDWEMWFKIALARGAAKTHRVVANYREHHSLGRGTTKVDVSGRKYAYVNMQRKRHYRALAGFRPGARFDRYALQRVDPMPTRFLVRHAHSFSDRMLKYNAGLLWASRAPHVSYLAFQWLTRLLGPRSLRFFSHLYRRFST
jgi:glycosyltransferase involved in cell wall biosynthesis